ncbi:MAG: Ig-like domain-containing protein [Crocinitomicaceae bacterium]|nr:Ig-like domain-containing protein [Crocinitomicaceae bacterium]
MFRNSFSFFFLGIFLFGCAEVGLITGGNKDTSAPKPIKINPEFGTTNFDVSEIEFEFDEYLKLNDPLSTISLSPNNSKIKASARGKNVTITFLDSLEENTTYQLQLNKTIKDITEGNDSLITYVFSTGQFLDSLNYNIQVFDAYSNKPVKNVNVGLFRENDSINPFYLRRTNTKGIANFNYLKKGKYYVKSWEEGATFPSNQDKKIGLLKSPIFIENKENDTTKIPFAFVERINAKISFHQLSDFLVAIKGVEHKDFLSVQLKNDSLRKRNTYWYSNDSILIESRYKTYDKIVLNYTLKDKKKDTTFLIETLKNEKTLSINPIKNKKQFKYNEPILFELNDFLFLDEFVLFNKIHDSKNWPFKEEKIIVLNNEIKIDTIDNEIEKKSISPVVKLIEPKQSIDGELVQDSLSFIGLKPNLFQLYVKDENSIKVIFKVNAIKGNLLLGNDSSEYNLEILSKNDLGSILLDVSDLDSTDVVCLLQNQKNIEQKKVNNKTILQFDDLFPGDYSFKIIKDKDNNQKWTQWSINPFKEPEKILWFNTPVKVRANWEMKMKLEINK